VKPAYFSVREYVFAALMAGGQFVCSSLTIPLTFALAMFGVNVIVYAPFGAFFLVLGLIRLRKPGSLALMGLLYALIGLIIAPVIFCFVISSALLAEAVCTVVFRGYGTRVAQLTGAVLHYSLMLPASLVFSLWLMPRDYMTAHFQAGVVAWLVAEGLIVIGSIAGGLLAMLVARELKRAGKLRTEES